MSKRAVPFRLILPGTATAPVGEDGDAWANAEVLFVLSIGTMGSGEINPAKVLRVVTGSDGRATPYLLVTEDAALASYWIVRFPDGREWSFTVPSGDVPIDLDGLILIGVAEANPPEESLITWIEDNIGPIYPPGEQDYQVFGVVDGVKGWYEPEQLLMATLEDVAAVWTIINEQVLPALLPPGGTTGQKVGKESDDDFDVEWQTDGGGTGGFHYEHNQEIAASVWNIAHGGGTYPSVTVVDTDGKTIEGDVQFIDNDNVQVAFSAAFSGRAYLN